jgi:4'-phosphopantetheinyl transferase
VRDAGRDRVDLWIVRPHEVKDPALLARFRSWLAEDELARLGGFHFDHHRHEYLMTRALARTALSDYRDVEPRGWQFAANAYGRPEIRPPCGIAFNLTNTQTLVACAVTGDRIIGIDTEPLARAPDILEIAETVFSAPEMRELRALDAVAARDRAVSLWTVKEAYMKARGMGMSLPPKEIRVAFAGTPRLVAAPDDPRPADWTLQLLDVGGDRVAVASPAPAPRIQLVEARWISAVAP